MPVIPIHPPFPLVGCWNVGTGELLSNASSLCCDPSCTEDLFGVQHAPNLAHSSCTSACSEQNSGCQLCNGCAQGQTEVLAAIASVHADAHLSNCMLLSPPVVVLDVNNVMQSVSPPVGRVRDPMVSSEAIKMLSDGLQGTLRRSLPSPYFRSILQKDGRPKLSPLLLQSLGPTPPPDDRPASPPWHHTNPLARIHPDWEEAPVLARVMERIGHKGGGARSATGGWS